AGRAPAPPLILIDDLDTRRRPAECNGTCLQLILALGTLAILHHLPRRRLADIHIREPIAMRWLNFPHTHAGAPPWRARARGTPPRRTGWIRIRASQRLGSREADRCLQLGAISSHGSRERRKQASSG